MSTRDQCKQGTDFTSSRWFVWCSLTHGRLVCIEASKAFLLLYSELSRKPELPLYLVLEMFEITTDTSWKKHWSLLTHRNWYEGFRKRLWKRAIYRKNVNKAAVISDVQVHPWILLMSVALLTIFHGVLSQIWAFRTSLPLTRLHRREQTSVSQSAVALASPQQLPRQAGICL